MNIRTLVASTLIGAALLTGCGRPEATDSGPALDRSAVKKTVSDPASALSSKIQATKAQVSSTVSTCVQDPACIEATVDQLLVATANKYLKSYSYVGINAAGAGTYQGSSGGKAVQYKLTNNGTGFVIASKKGSNFGTLPPERKAGIGLSASAISNSVAPYLGVALIYVDVNAKMIAVGGADIYGYTYCYGTLGYPPVCAQGGW